MGGPSGFSFPDGCRADGFILLDSTGADGFSFFNGLHCLRVILTRSIPSSQTAFHLWVSMDDLVANSSSRALLAFSQSWPMSAGSMTFLNLGNTAMGEMVVGTSPNEASAISTLSWVLTWDKVSTSLGRSFSL